MLLLSQSVVGRILNFSRAAKAEPCGRSDGARCSCSLGLGGQMAEEVAVAVCVRVKPLSSRELEESTHVYWKTDNNAIYQIDGSKSFSFDRVFHSDETTKNVYDEIAVPIIDSAIQGYNGTIFAYGQTASGKTHTMMGSGDCLGVIPRAIHDIFQKVKKFPEREFLLRVSYMEIYNETITDLLCNTQKMKPLIIREDINRNVYVADLTEEVVYTSEMALQWLSKGEKNRHYGITKMNQGSSHSHTIFRMILESRENGESSNVDGSIKVSHLNLVDLAGSERAAQTGAEGVRLKEGCNINQSLFILGQVIKKLSDEQTGGFINYQDSKLTRILQNSLGGNAKTCIICTITPVSFDETLTTLQFASTAKYMKNTPFVNEVSSDGALLKRYRKEIMDLKKQLEDVSIKTRAQEMEKDQLAQLLEEKGLLQKIQDEKIQNLQQMLVTSSSIDLQQELKAKNKRRVTWCLGKINKMKDSTNGNEFEISTNITTRSRKASVTVLRERDESVCFESDTFGNTLEPLTEIEWSSATKLLSQENLEGELNSLHAKYDDLVLDNEQLRRQNEDLELQLKEKQELDEFEALERKLVKEQEIPVLHEEHMLLPNVREVSECPETVNELEPVEEQSKPMDSTTLENLAMERLKLMEKLQGKEEERKHLNKPKDNWKMLKGFQLEYNLLKEGITENFAEIPVLHEEHVLLPNVREVSECPETVNELEPVREQSKPMDSTTLRNLAMERLKLMEKLQGKEEERKHPNKPKDNWKMLKGFQLEYNLLKKGITENFAEIPVLHEEHVLLPNVREVSECPETVNELEPVEEQSKPMDSTTLENLAMERLKLMEKLQGKEEERKHPNKPKDNWKMLKGFQLEYNLLKKALQKILLKKPFICSEP